eukprot:CAMPEP_0118956244 /NCGR_PEP_ID=MMETSP1169-20130426/61379_1 /TAXON_ID=36882 /ORGANISM="Pyramimonas obovata, Strain CCMP722" /LENGTH=148 /DNA_ID=CAMNT_0006904237 /DNA_START=281 /DNA_END=724 /DNA_ORIENTATION=+
MPSRAMSPLSPRSAASLWNRFAGCCKQPGGSPPDGTGPKDALRALGAATPISQSQGAVLQKSSSQSSEQGMSTPKADASRNAPDAAAQKPLVSSKNSSPDTDRKFVEEAFSPEDLAHTKNELARLMESLSEKDPQSLWKVEYAANTLA